MLCKTALLINETELSLITMRLSVVYNNKMSDCISSPSRCHSVANSDRDQEMKTVRLGVP